VGDHWPRTFFLAYLFHMKHKKDEFAKLLKAFKERFNLSLEKLSAWLDISADVLCEWLHGREPGESSRYTTIETIRWIELNGGNDR
jgi:hypothetical protein